MTTAPLQPIDLSGGLEPIPSAPAPPLTASSSIDLSGGLEPVSAPLTEKDAATSTYATQQASDKFQDLPAKDPSHVRFQATDGSVHDVPSQYLSRAKQIDPNLKILDSPNGDPEDRGVTAGIKRNTVGVITGLYHAFTDPASDQEKAELLQKVRDLNQKENANIPEDLATNPKQGTLVLHRILDAPADVLAKKGDNEEQIAKDLISHNEYWRGGNIYLSGLADKALAVVPVIGPAINATAERAESGDISGAATDVGSMLALENAPTLLKAGSKAVEGASDLAGSAANKINTTQLRPEQLTKRPETPAAQHGTPVTVESPLDGPTVGRQLGGKDLSQEALNTLQQHIGDTIPVGGSARNSLFSAVEPVSKAISDGVSKMNAAVKDAPAFTTSIAQDNGLGEGTLNSDLEAMKKRLPASDRFKLSADVDDVLTDADKALNSNDPIEILEHRRQLGRQIDWDKIEKNPSTPQEVQNAARARVYRALGEKIHDEIPATVEIDKGLQPNLELMSHMKSKLGERVVDDPHAATVEHQSELKKGKATIDNATHNDAVDKRWKVIKPVIYGALGAAGIGSADKIINTLEGLF
jgi:hypothetical protein